MNLPCVRRWMIAATLSCISCGGLVVFEEDDGSGGSGGTASVVTSNTSSSISSNTSTSTGTVDVCEALSAELATAIDHARACSPLKPVIQCDGSVTLLDECACPSFVANEHLVDEIQAAHAAYDAWVAQGCGPYPCENCKPAMGGFCEARVDASKGRCEAFGPD